MTTLAVSVRQIINHIAQACAYRRTRTQKGDAKWI